MNKYGKFIGKRWEMALETGGGWSWKIIAKSR